MPVDQIGFSMKLRKKVLIMFKNLTVLVLTGCFLIAGLVQPATAQNALPKETRDKIEIYLNVEKEKNGIVGHSVAILKNGTLVYTEAEGLASIELNVKADVKTVYQSFSFAKLFVHVTMMQLVESKKIELEAPIDRYLTNLPETWNKISVRQIMSHLSGLPEYYRWPNPTPKTSLEALQSVANKALEFKTGSETRYNQTNYLVLKMIIEEVTGQDFLTVVTTQMIEKLKLESTQYGGEYAVIPGRATTYRSTETGLKKNGPIDQPDYMFVSSGLNTNAIDLAIWFGALLEGKFISPEMMKTMWQPLYLNNGKVARFANGWEYFDHDGMTVFGHGGGNRVDLRHFIRESDDENFTIIYLTNGSEKDFWPGNVSLGLADIILSMGNSSQN